MRKPTDSNTNVTMAADKAFNAIEIDNTAAFKAEVSYQALVATDATIRPQTGADGETFEDIYVDGEVLEYEVEASSGATRLDIRLTGLVPGEFVRLQYLHGTAAAGTITKVKYVC